MNRGSSGVDHNWRVQYDFGDADSDPFGGFSHRVADETCIARGRPNPAVTEQSADDRQPLAEGQCPRGIAVATVVQPHVVEPGPLPDGVPVVAARGVPSDFLDSQWLPLPRPVSMR